MKAIVMRFHAAVNLFHAVGGLVEFDVFAFLWGQAGGFSEVVVKTATIPPAVF